MQYPVADLSKIADGVIRFTSQDDRVRTAASITTLNHKRQCTRLSAVSLSLRIIIHAAETWHT